MTYFALDISSFDSLLCTERQAHSMKAVFLFEWKRLDECINCDLFSFMFFSVSCKLLYIVVCCMYFLYCLVLEILPKLRQVNLFSVAILHSKF